MAFLRKKPIAICIAIIVSSAGLVAAQDLSGSEIKELISGKRVDLSARGFSVPLRYATNGSVTGDVSGISAARLLTPSETGKWWTDANRMCQQWPTWYDGKTFCFQIEKTGENAIAWTRDDGFSGTAKISD